jgi:hypothetical protein
MRGKTSRTLCKFCFTHPQAAEGISAKEHIKYVTITDKDNKPKKVPVKTLQKFNSYRQIKKGLYRHLNNMPRSQRGQYLHKIKLSTSAMG